MTDHTDPRTTAQFTENLLAVYDQRLPAYESALRRVTDNLVAVTRDRERFTPSQQRRIRVETGRVKEPARLLAKAQSGKYGGLIEDVQDIFEVVTDIIGTRVTCNTVQDVVSVVSAIQASATLNSPSHIPEDKASEDYIVSPKESGYRAVHLLVTVDVPIGSRYEPVVCEIQIRTLLQNAWGELTHEDTFKPETKVPRLVAVLSKRLATALAVLDEIAQDLRDELAKIEDEPPPSPEVAPDLPKPDESSLNEGFASAMGRQLQLPKGHIAALAQSLGREGIVTVDAVRDAMLLVREQQAVVFSANPVLINDADLLRAASRYAEGPDAVRDSLWAAANHIAKQIDALEQFQETYFEGAAFVGTVLRVRPRYALVQLTTGETATLSVRHLEAGSNARLNLEDYLAPGASVRVEVVHADPHGRRIEIRPIEKLRQL